MSYRYLLDDSYCPLDDTRGERFKREMKRLKITQEQLSRKPFFTKHAIKSFIKNQIDFDFMQKNTLALMHFDMQFVYCGCTCDEAFEPIERLMLNEIRVKFENQKSLLYQFLALSNSVEIVKKYVSGNYAKDSEYSSMPYGVYDRKIKNSIGYYKKK